MSQQKYQKIGSGFCGTVWARSLDGPAIKREDGGPARSLANDFRMHQRALAAFKQMELIKGCRKHRQVCIPQCYRFIEPENITWWIENLPFLPPGYLPCNAICSDRIPPFPQDTRGLLAEKYCRLPPETRLRILASSANQACLIRPYIGRQRTYRTEMNMRSKFRVLSLQNFPLHVDQMNELGIPSDDIDCYAAMMGEALATLHWFGEMDGNDVEFVLAPLPRRRDESNKKDYTTITNILGKHTMWMLDFDLCRSLSMDLDGVQQAVNAFFKNDPFTPRPNTKHWAAFRRQYLQTARDVICEFSGEKAGLEDRLYLSSQFIELVERQE